MIFTAGYIEQVLTRAKKLPQIRADVFKKNVKSAQLRRTPNRKNDVTEPKATL